MAENLDIKNAYDKWSRTYDYDENPTRDLDQKVIREVLVDIKDKDIIEPGCGTGKNTIWFAESARSVVSFDISDEMLKLARSKVKKGNVEFLRHSLVEIWPVADNSCDVVSINLVLEHLPDISFVFNEAYRVLRNNGRLFICELHPEKQRKGSKARFVDNESKDIVEIVAYYHPENEYLKAGKSAGFTNISIRDWFDGINKDIPRVISVLLTKGS